MAIDGRWSATDDQSRHDLKLGSAYHAIVERRGGDSIYANCWIATLNGRWLTETSDLDYAKGRVEWEIVKEMMALSAAYRELKIRAPTSSNLFPDGAWARWKAARKA